jgi:carbon-monoxide dehydrogenase medium subunit
MLTFTNTHLLLNEFQYVEPGSIDEATSVLAEHAGEARVLAGGTDLLVQMKLERAEPRCLVGLRRLAGLRRISGERDVVLGAAATIRAVSRSPVVRERYTALKEACEAFSTVQVMVMGTIGGNICNASPAADTAPPLLAFDAHARLVAPGAERSVPLDEFFLGPGRTVLRDGELLESIRLASSAVPRGSAFLKLGRVAADISKVSVAVRIDRDGDRAVDCRVALGAVAPTPVRSHQAERLLRGQRLSAGLVRDAAHASAEEIRPLSDVRSTVAYRRHVADVLVEDALTIAWRRAGGKDFA